LWITVVSALSDWGQPVTNISQTQGNIEPTELEVARIRRDLTHRNSIRREAQMPVLDLQKEMLVEINRIRRRNYTALLEPYLLKATEEHQGARGLVGRLQVRHNAEKALRDATGLLPPASRSHPLISAIIASRSTKPA